MRMKQHTTNSTKTLLLWCTVLLSINLRKTTAFRVGTSFVPRPTTCLFAQSPRPRRPRRKLQKRRRKRAKNPNEAPAERQEGVDDTFWQTAESRPLVGWASKEQGEDYWIDEEDLEREKERLARKPPEPGQISEEKLWSEVLSPYRQNWIGIVSVIIVILATIITQFPELLNTPSIPIPDL